MLEQGVRLRVVAVLAQQHEQPAPAAVLSLAARALDGVGRAGRAQARHDGTLGYRVCSTSKACHVVVI
jgi:hypothetical protein